MIFKIIIIIIFFIFINISYSAVNIPKEYLLGDWEVIMFHNILKKDKRKLKGALYYQFTDANMCIITNIATRKRVNWLWLLKNNKLILTQSKLNKKKIGIISFFKKKNGEIIRKFKYTYTLLQRKKIRPGKFKVIKLGPFVMILE